MYHGPWLQLPTEVLESLALHNYASPLPRPIDAGVFFDLVKIRRLVDHASDLAVRASNGTTSSSLSASLKAGHNLLGSNGAAALGLGIGGGTGKLSSERRYRIRELATRKLAEAYDLDEVAASVATMQSASTLEDVARLVLERNPRNNDARYVHFFHEKIPSRTLAQNTDLEVLNRLVLDRHNEASPFRTRALTKIFKENFAGAAGDLTEALSKLKSHPAHDKADVPSSQKIDSFTPSEVPEEERPTSLRSQLHFQRAGVYLTMSCQSIDKALPKQASDDTFFPHGSHDGDTLDEKFKALAYRDSNSEPTPEEQLENCKKVRYFAKRALKDYLGFLSLLSYSAQCVNEYENRYSFVNDSPAELIKKAQTGVAKAVLPGSLSSATDSTEQLNASYAKEALVSTTDQIPSAGSANTAAAGRKIYTVAALFSATPPNDLPPDRNVEKALARPGKIASVIEGEGENELVEPMESVTYHPLLPEALHCLLLCHSLLQTSQKEQLRHAYMVARIIRSLDGYPIFVPGRSSSRTDWVELNRLTGNWLGLEQTWDRLCDLHFRAGNAGSILESRPRSDKEIQQDAVIAALADERVCDEQTFQTAVSAHKRRAKRQLLGPVPMSELEKSKDLKQSQAEDFFIGTVRACAIARWINQAPSSTKKHSPTGKRRKAKEGKSSLLNAHQALDTFSV